MCDGEMFEVRKGSRPVVLRREGGEDDDNSVHFYLVRKVEESIPQAGRAGRQIVKIYFH